MSQLDVRALLSGSHLKNHRFHVLKGFRLKRLSPVFVQATWHPAGVGEPQSRGARDADASGHPRPHWPPVVLRASV